jgi:ubiquitin C-terminal hydrolase
VYDLYGVVQHYGSMLGGHYTACAKQPGTGEWLFFDDERVERMRSAEDAKSSAAYLLFYKRRDLREPEGQLLSGVEG